MNETATYQINLNAVGKGSVKINDQEISSHIQGINIVAEQSKAVEIYLQAVPGSLELEGEGIVYVLSESSVEKFLDGLDAEIVKSMALNSLGLDGLGGDDPVIAAVECIKQLWRESNGG